MNIPSEINIYFFNFNIQALNFNYKRFQQYFTICKVLRGLDLKYDEKEKIIQGTIFWKI